MLDFKETILKKINVSFNNGFYLGKCWFSFDTVWTQVILILLKKDIDIYKLKDMWDHQQNWQEQQRWIF